MNTKSQVAGYFSNSREKWLNLYEQLYLLIEQKLGTFEEYVTSGGVNWKHNSSFAEVSAKKDCMIVALPSDSVHDDWEASKVVQTSKNRVMHSFEVTDDSMFYELQERIVKAYDLTKSNRPRQNRTVTENIEYNTVDEYIALFEGEIKGILEKTREIIKKAAPDAVEKISWQMPTFYQKENLIHFAAGKNHLGIYPGSMAIIAFQDRLTEYKTSKGAIQFPYSKPIPYELIEEITRFRVNDVTSK